MSYSPYNLDAARAPKTETKRVILIVIASMIGFVLLVAFLALALSMPALLSSRRAANEAAAVATLRAIASAEETYQTANERYGTVEELVAGGYVDARPNGGAFEKDGYVFKLTLLPANEYMVARYAVTASPVTSSGLRATGTRHFYYDSFAVAIHANETGPATSHDPVVY